MRWPEPQRTCVNAATGLANSHL